MELVFFIFFVIRSFNYIVLQCLFVSMIGFTVERGFSGFSEGDSTVPGRVGLGVLILGEIISIFDIIDEFRDSRDNTGNMWEVA